MTRARERAVERLVKKQGSKETRAGGPQLSARRGVSSPWGSQESERAGSEGVEAGAGASPRRAPAAQSVCEQVHPGGAHRDRSSGGRCAPGGSGTCPRAEEGGGRRRWETQGWDGTEKANTERGKHLSS